MTMRIMGGIDVGNGYVKGLLVNLKTDSFDEIDMPSQLSTIMRANDLPVSDIDAPDVITGDFYNELDVSFASALVPDNHRHLFGVRSLTANGSPEFFDIVGRQSKARQALSKEIILGVIAGKAVRDSFAENGKLPEPSKSISVDARIALALPIDQYIKHRVGYASGFTTGIHTVNILNFENPITVKIKFSDVQIIAEGASAQYAITAKGEPLMDAMLQDVRQRGLALEGISSSDVLAAQNTIGIDVGEGTVNFPVFTAGKFNSDTSMTFSKGYGTVLDNALVTMDAKDMNVGFTNRKQLADYLHRGPSKITAKMFAQVKSHVDAEAELFAREVADQFGRVLAVVGATTEVAYVYGGGAGALKDVLYPLLLAKVTEMNGPDSFPVLYLDSSYSRHLNREGLYVAAKSVYESSRKRKSLNS